MGGFKPGPVYLAYYRARQKWRENPTEENHKVLVPLFHAKMAERERQEEDASRK